MKRRWPCIVLGIVLSALATHPALAQISHASPNCGTVSGKTERELENVDSFCKQGIRAGRVVSAYANGTILRVQVSRQMADGMRADRLTAEQLVRLWMKGWKQNTREPVVSVTVKWEDVEIATGETTIFSGDQVKIR